MSASQSGQLKTVAITGAASGIGAHTARLLIAQDIEVIALDRHAPDFDVTRFIQIDLADPLSIDAAAAQLPGTLDGLCNVAGVPGNAGGDIVARVNYLGLRRLTEAVLPKLRADGSIVNVASTAGQNWQARRALHVELAATRDFTEGLQWLEQHPVPDAGAYAYFKEALIVWTMARATTLRSATGIRMNCISPGPTDTPILKDFRASLGAANVDDAIRRAGGVGTPEAMAPAIVFLLQAQSAWINGVNLPVDGGLVASRILDPV
ncbi:short-chain dehydrogenase/reductase SDR [Caballeronia cordobensis]|uniref:Short-chain dehydrogenase/reductase SDR n=1 Tax=Caballeronia cordobensis TaxID=1353886 RepID=A0A158I5E8_CABCO|nr:coniferyl-alcohol dehydrogenase [Caballeronia cordobensis]SAL51808.1 short-chain dehydrogenase/reductase SDR [Caballeronia cordobensis]